MYGLCIYTVYTANRELRVQVCVCVWGVEKMPSHAEHTGKPIDSGGIVTLHVEGVGTQASEYVDRVVLQHSFSGMLEIRDSGCTLYT